MIEIFLKMLILKEKSVGDRKACKIPSMQRVKNKGNLIHYSEESTKMWQELLTMIKPVLNSHSQKDQKIVFNTDYRLMQVKSIAEGSKGGIQQYFRRSLSYHLSLRSLFCLFLCGRLRQVLLY